MLKISPTTFDGLQALQIATNTLQMIVVTQLGPRVAFFGKQGGDNLFYWKNDDIGREGWRLLGGHRVWVTRPGADESEDAYAVDNNPCTVQQEANRVTITGGVHPVFKIQRGLQIDFIDDNTLRVTGFLTNRGPMLYSGGVWSPTCILPRQGMRLGIPLGDNRLTWDVVKLIIPRRFAGHTSPVNDEQITFSQDFMLIDPQGVETKRMVMAPLGMIALSWPQKGYTFVKYSPFRTGGNYPLGCNLAVYVAPNNLMVEMETYGEEQTVLPEQTITNREVWTILDEVPDWQSVERFMELEATLRAIC